MAGTVGKRCKPARPCGRCGKPIMGDFQREKNADYHESCWWEKRNAAATETRGPLFNKDGTVAVDQARCPVLYRAITRMRERVAGRGDWAHVVELRRNGDVEGAERAARKAMGVKGEPMDEETKAKLRAYEAEHKDEILARRKAKRELRRRTVALLTTGKRLKV